MDWHGGKDSKKSVVVKNTKKDDNDFAKKLGLNALFSFSAGFTYAILATIYDPISITRAMDVTSYVGVTDAFYVGLSTFGVVLAGLLVYVLLSTDYTEKEKFNAKVGLGVLTVLAGTVLTTTLSLTGNSLSQVMGVSSSPASALATTGADILLGLILSVLLVGLVVKIADLGEAFKLKTAHLTIISASQKQTPLEINFRASSILQQTIQTKASELGNDIKDMDIKVTINGEKQADIKSAGDIKKLNISPSDTIDIEMSDGLKI